MVAKRQRRASPAFERSEGWLRSDLVGSYQALGDLVCAYARGSLVEGFTNDADIDVVLVWAKQLPESSRRPPPGLADLDQAPVIFDEPGFVIDRIWRAGQQFDVKHTTRREVDGWIDAVEAGNGRSGYPMPVIEIHGLTAGVVLADEQGYAAAIRDRLAHVPAAFRQAARMSDEALGAYLQELERCAERGDDLLFHSLAVDAVRSAFIGWFANNDRYWPHEKRLLERLKLLGQRDLVELERRVWIEDTLAARLAAMRELLARLRRT
jgi:Domain of unknown function (DUF4037)